MSTSSKAEKRNAALLPPLQDDTSTCMPELPPEVLCRVLQHVAVKQRMSSCTLVCRAWQQAAQAATTSMSVSVSRDAGDSLSRWLNSHGSKLEHLSVENDSSKAVSLGILLMGKPCLLLDFHNLNRLLSLNVSVHLAPMTAAAAAGAGSQQQVPEGSVGALTALTRLQLSSVAADFRQLHKCSSLRHLQLDSVTQLLSEVYPAHAQMFEAAIASALQPLVQLTHLTLQTDTHSQSQPLGSALQHLSCLKHLQHLALGGRFRLCPELLSHPWIVGLTRLDLKDVEVDPSCDNWESGLLAVLGGLQKLQHLDLQGALQNKPEDPTSYMTLTAAAQLTYLGLGDCYFFDVACQYLFPPDKQLLQLQDLVATDNLFRQPGSFHSLVNSCPSLRHLTIADHSGTARGYGFVHNGGITNGLLDLSQLSGLTALTLKGLQMPDRVAAEIAGLTRLKSVDILEAHDMSSRAVSSLVSLTNLEYLQLITNFHYAKPYDDDGDVEDFKNGTFGPRTHRYILHNQEPPGCKPNVTRQLEQLLQVYFGYVNAGQASMQVDTLMDVGPK